MTMINWIKRLFHLHEYEVIKELSKEVPIATPSGQCSIITHVTYIQRCKCCGKIIKQTIKLF